MKYKIIITKNRQPFRLVKTFSNKNNAIKYFENLIIENSKVKFDKQFLNYIPCTFHIELLTPIKYHDIIEWEKDTLGRNIKAPDRNGLFIWKLKPWKEPEYFKIYGLPDRYDYDFLYNTIKRTKDLISLSIIQNIVILDIDGKPLLVMLKNIQDAHRLYKLIVSENFKHVLPFGVMSKENRKEFYKKMKNMGIPVKMFYTKSTRW